MASGPMGVRLWGALKPPLRIPFHHPAREALKPQGELLPLFSFLFFCQTVRCGLANSQSESCLHSVTDKALAPRQPIGSLHTKRHSLVNIWDNVITEVRSNNMEEILESLSCLRDSVQSFALKQKASSCSKGWTHYKGNVWCSETPWIIHHYYFIICLI